SVLVGESPARRLARRHGPRGACARRGRDAAGTEGRRDLARPAADRPRFVVVDAGAGERWRHTLAARAGGRPRAGRGGRARRGGGRGRGEGKGPRSRRRATVWSKGGPRTRP